MTEYDWPEDLLLPLALWVGGTDWGEPSDRGSVKAYEAGDLVLQRSGAWYDGATATGERSLHLYPPPSSGLAIELEWVFRPAPISELTASPTEIPPEFHIGLLYEGRAYYFEEVEDNPELAQRNSEKADLIVNELGRYDSERRTGRGVFMPAIVGQTG